MTSLPILLPLSAPTVRGLAAIATLLGVVLPATAQTILPDGFQETTVLSGLDKPIVVKFASDGRVFVAEKSGKVKIFQNLDDSTPETFIDLDAKVQNYFDRGLTGLALDPKFPIEPYVYVLYAYDAPPGGTHPTFGDTCPDPPGGTIDGCVVSARLSRLTADGNRAVGDEHVLIEDWCFQFKGHATGGLEFGPDGALYATSGDGSSSGFTDYGQRGIPLNPCGDPPAGVGGNQTLPDTEGGALRSQDLRTSGDPVGLGGTVIRINPLNGDALSDNPAAGALDLNEERIIAYGLRNPFGGITVQPNSGDLWVGDVGWNRWEEINRIGDLSSGVVNFGWPCFEGSRRQESWDALDVTICENLYTDSVNPATPPFFEYKHTRPIVDGEECKTGGSSVSSMVFEPGAGTWPAPYAHALFFADYSRGCIFMLSDDGTGTNNPDPTQPRIFGVGASFPLNMVFGPSGDMFYVDHKGGTIRRVSFVGDERAPMAVVSASPTEGNRPLTVRLDGSASTYPGNSGDALTYEWDTDGDGQYDDGTTPQLDVTYTTMGTFQVRLRVFDQSGLVGISDPVSIHVENMLPIPSIDIPQGGYPLWSVGDMISFSGSATDNETEGLLLPPSSLSWTIDLHHCETTDQSSCHIHTLQTVSGVSEGTFPAPDHEYPSWLVLTLTADDGVGGVVSTTTRLDPATVKLTMMTQPAGLCLEVGLGSEVRFTPFTVDVIVGSTQTVSAPTPQLQPGGGRQGLGFTSWSDGGLRSHEIVVTETMTLTATFASAPCSPGEFFTEYYANQALSGDPVFLRCETEIKNDWRYKAPAPDVPKNKFSIRWSINVGLDVGYWNFTTRADDGIRLYVDGYAVIDNWTNQQGSTTVDSSVTARLLNGSSHDIEVEYYDNTGVAIAEASWTDACANVDFVCPNNSSSIIVLPPPPPPPVAPMPPPCVNAVRINCGGNVVNYSGHEFEGHYGFNTGLTKGNPDGDIYASEREDKRTGENLIYNLRVGTVGTYNCTLHFKESQFTEELSRRFHVYIQNEQKLKNFDIYKVGGNANIQESFEIEVSDDGMVKVELKPGGKSRATINAIEIIPLLNTDPGSPLPETPCPPTTPTPKLRTPGWELKTSVPSKIGEIAAGIINGKMYVVGEGDEATFCYDIKNDMWTKLGEQYNRPKQGHHHGAEVYNNKLYLIGGLSNGSQGTIQIFSPEEGWQMGQSMDTLYPDWQGGSVNSALVGNKIYVCGGIAKGSTIDTVEYCGIYDPEENSWSEMDPMPYGRNHAATATDGTSMYIFGGRDGKNRITDGFDEVQIYDTETGIWKTSTDSNIPALPQKRGGTGKAVYFQGKFYILGGETQTNPPPLSATPKLVYDRVDIYDTQTNEWTLGKPMPKAKHGVFPLLHEGTIIVAGGGWRAGNSQSDHCQIYTL